MLSFPLYKDDGRASVPINELQKEAIKIFMSKIEAGAYRLEYNPCLCGRDETKYDITVTEKDRYGIPCRYILCRYCGLIRLEKRLDDESTAAFYRDDYRNIYVGRELASEEFFDDQVRHGEELCRFTERFADMDKIHTVFEAGCGAGGILYAFHQRRKEASGCDFGKKYLAYGIDHSLKLYEGEPDLARTPANSQNLIILSHVLEHLNRPLEYINNLAEMLTPEGYMLVQLPGLFYIRKSYINPIRYFQNAHVYNYYYYHLKTMFETLGLEVIYGDESCTFLLRKPVSWLKKDTEGLIIWDKEMPEWSRKIEAALKKYYFLRKVAPRYLIVNFLEFIGIKDTIKRLIGRK